MLLIQCTPSPWQGLEIAILESIATWFWQSVGEHWHALMAIRGNHGWSKQQIADAINEIERNSKMRQLSEKALHVDFDWKNGNAFHSYIAREVKFGAKRWEIEKKAKREAKNLVELRDIERSFKKTKIDKTPSDNYFVMSL